MMARVARRWLRANWTKDLLGRDTEPEIQLVFMTTGDENRRVVLIDPNMGGVPPMAFYESSGTGGSGAYRGDWVPFYGFVVIYPELGGRIWFAKHPGGKVPPEGSLERRLAWWISRNLKESPSFSVDFPKKKLGKIPLKEIREAFEEIARGNRALAKVLGTPEAKKARGEGYFIGSALETSKSDWWTFENLKAYYGLTKEQIRTLKRDTGISYLDMTISDLRDFARTQGWKP